MPNNGGGATGVGRQLLMELARQGIEVDCFFPGEARYLPGVLVNEPNLRFFCQSSGWQWNRWYSRNNYMAFVTGQFANLQCEMKLAEKLAEQHKRKPYDLVYQFSHIEMHALRKYRRRLPPIVLHPSVHSAGELRWHRKEAHLAKHSESLLTRAAVRLMLLARSVVQKRHIRSADYVLSISRNFAEDISRDYKIAPEKTDYIVPNPIDLERFQPRPELADRKDDRITFLFVSRISVRKGTEMIVELSHRLRDLTGEVRILVVGNHSLWSDYRGLLTNLNPETAAYLGQLSGKEMEGLYNSIDVLIQPSHYEPFGLTVAEALGSGLPVIASDKVGAAERVNAQCCRVFEAGNMDEMERHARDLYRELRAGRKPELAKLARSEAERLFTNSMIVSDLIAKLRTMAAAGTATTSYKGHSKGMAAHSQRV